MNGPTAAVEIFFLLLCVKRLLLSLTPLLHYDTHTRVHARAHTHTHTHTHARTRTHAHMSTHLVRLCNPPHVGCERSIFLCRSCQHSDMHQQRRSPCTALRCSCHLYHNWPLCRAPTLRLHPSILNDYPTHTEPSASRIKLHKLF